MNKIEFKDLPDTSTPLNASNLNLIQSNIEDEFERLENYSTNEIVIGKWIDNKPVYRKVFVTRTPSSTLWTSVATASNVETMVDLRGTFYGNDGRQMSVNHPEKDYQVSTTYLNDRIEMKVEDPTWYNLNCFIIFEYTKTTD